VALRGKAKLKVPATGVLEAAEDADLDLADPGDEGLLITCDTA